MKTQQIKREEKNVSYINMEYNFPITSELTFPEYLNSQFSPDV